jgi:hypothetical protein
LTIAGFKVYYIYRDPNQPYIISEREGYIMNMTEASRIILGLRAAGWEEKDINDFILYVETGEEQYKPKNIIPKNE